MAARILRTVAKYCWDKLDPHGLNRRGTARGVGVFFGIRINELCRLQVLWTEGGKMWGTREGHRTTFAQRICCILLLGLFFAPFRAPSPNVGRLAQQACPPYATTAENF